MTYYKFLTDDGKAPFSGWQWPLPTKRWVDCPECHNDEMLCEVCDGDGGFYEWTPGEWTPVVDTLVECESGYHYTDAEHLLQFADATLYELEVAPEACSEWYGDKGACTQCRLVRQIEAWNGTLTRLFACECAERVVPLFELRYSDDKRPRAAIETARRFANGEATRDEMAAAEAAARDAARAAARDAAWAAGAAERAWQTARLREMLGI